MADQLQLRGGTTSEHSTFTGALREVTVDTDKDTLIVHDAATAGGHPLLREDGSNSALSLGTAGTPSIKFTGDTNTGLYSPGADQVAISTAGTGRLFVDANGRVGIGTSSPSRTLTISTSDPRIGIVDTDAGGAFQIRNTSGAGYVITEGAHPLIFNTNNAERLRITETGELKHLAGNAVGSPAVYFAGSAPSNSLYVQATTGRVGVGTSSPAGRLEIKDNGYRQGIVLERGGSTTDRGFIYIGDGTNSTVADEIYLDAYNTAFHFRQGGTGTTETVTFKSDGKVGVGTTSPLNTLHVNQSASGDILRLNTTSGSGQGIILGVDTSGGFTYWKNNTSASYDMRFEVGGGEKLRIDSSGRVGIGTSSPADFSSGAANLVVSATDGNNGGITINNEGANLGSIFFANTISEGAQGRIRYDHSADSLSITTNGNSSNGIFIDSSQRVGIGTTAPGSFNAAANNLVVGTGSGNEGITIYAASDSQSRIDFKDSADTTETGILYYSHASDSMIVHTAGSERARIDSSGRLLVGTSTARSVAGVTGGFHLTGTGADSCLNVSRYSANTGPAILQFGKSRGTSDGSYTIVSDGDQLGSITFAGADGTDLNSIAANIAAQVDGTPGANDMPGRLVFSTTADGASSPTERMRITNDGVVKIGADFDTAASVTSTQFVVRNGLGGAIAEFNRTDNVDSTLRNLIRFARGATTVGQINVSNSATQYATSSDYRLKENITSITDGITRLKQLNPSRFNFIIDPDNIVDGFLAHEVQSIVPEAVNGEKDAVDEEGNPEYQGIDQSKLVPLLTAALQEAIAKIETLEANNVSLEARLAALEAN